MGNVQEMPEAETGKRKRIYCVLDYETFSEAPLKKVGAFEYSVHPSTDILCAAWRVGTREDLPKAKTHWWSPLLGGGDLGTLYQSLLSPDVTIVAHNALFEQVITRNVFAVKHMYSKREELQLPPNRWICTAALGAALALPRSLEGMGSALKLRAQKDMAGHRLMMKWCKPRKPTKHDKSTRHSDPSELKALIRYCQKDVDVETALFLKLPPLTPTERKLWVLDQQINLRGFAVDRDLVGRILELIAVETGRHGKKTEELSLGLFSTTRKVQAVLNWLEAEGVYLPNLQKKTVEDAINGGMVKGAAKEMLKLRQAVSKTSTAKYEAFEMRSRHDGRLRDILVFHAASTGRWGGAGVQPQNFPRGTIGKKDVEYAVALLKGEVEV